MDIQNTVVEKFLRYIQMDTQSDDSVLDRLPTTEKQWDLARLLVKELQELGLTDAKVNDKCFVTATLPANTEKKIPVIGWLAHLDTSQDYSGKNVRAQIIEKYDGSDIPLNKSKGLVLSLQQFPQLKRYTGQKLITTDGTSLLGADDKAGVAEIMTAMEYLVNHPECKHGALKIAFTPDEETGMGIEHFEVKEFGADFAYTVDGSGLGELEYENFNANRATITFHGKSVHAGDAKGVMVNSMLVAMEFNALLPERERPEYTADREGFYHLLQLDGNVAESKAIYLIRDHDRQKFEVRKQSLLQCAEAINAKYGASTVEVLLEDRYFNMREVLEKVFHIVESAQQAMLELGIQPVIKPIRGGTDGSRLAFMGLPAPNLFTGGHNPHGPYEYIPTLSMEKAVQAILKIIEIYAKK